MRALNVAAPWGLEAIEVVEKPDPAPGPGQVLVRMKAVSLNYRDLLMVNGMYGRGAASSKDVITPFSDGCGYVEAVGDGVTRFKVGDRVSTLFFQLGKVIGDFRYPALNCGFFWKTKRVVACPLADAVVNLH